MCACVKGSYITCALSLCWQAVISRGNLMKQAEKLIDDLGWSKAVLEIQYEDEVCMCVCVCVWYCWVFQVLMNSRSKPSLSI